MTDNNPPSPSRSGPPVVLISIVIVLSTALSPPLMRMFGPDLWQGFGFAQQGWSILRAIQGFILVLFVLSSGVLADLFGRKRVLTLLLVFHMVLLTAGIFVPNRVSLITVLTGLAVSSSMITPLIITFIVVFYSGAARIKAITLFAGASAISITLIPLVDNWLLTSEFVWVMFAIPLAAAAIGLYLMRRYIPTGMTPDRPRPINVIIVAIWAAAVCAMAYGLLLIVGLGPRDPIGWLFLIGGVASLVAIGHFETNPVSEEMRYELHRERPLTIAIISGIILALALKTISGQLYYFFKDIQDTTVVVSALRLVPIVIGAVLLGALAARITDRQGDRAALALGLGVMGLSALGLSVLEPDIAYAFVAPLLIFAGFGYVLGNSPRVLLLSRSVPRQLETTVQAIGVATSQVGGAMAYTMTLGLITIFTSRIYSDALTSAGVSADVIDRQLALVELVTNATRGAIPPEQQADTIAAIIPAYELAHTEAVTRMLIVLGLICFAVALIVFFGVEEEEMDAAPVTLPPDDSVEDPTDGASTA